MIPVPGFEGRRVAVFGLGRSGITAAPTGARCETPEIVRRDVPSPSICAPIAIRCSPAATTSGSMAAFQIVVSPSANVAAAIRLYVAPTDETSSVIVEPVNRSARASM